MKRTQERNADENSERDILQHECERNEKKKKTKCISQTLAIKIAMALKKYIALTIAIAFNLLSHSYLCTSFPRLYAKTVNAETITLCEQNELQNIHSKCSFGLLLKHDDERKKNLDKTSGIDRLNVRVVYRVWNRKSACILAFLFIFTPSTIQNAVEEKKQKQQKMREIFRSDVGMYTMNMSIKLCSLCSC